MWVKGQSPEAVGNCSPLRTSLTLGPRALSLLRLCKAVMAATALICACATLGSPCTTERHLCAFALTILAAASRLRMCEPLRPCGHNKYGGAVPLTPPGGLCGDMATHTYIL
ncbi:hypothetical protein FKM82_026786 [Ascaphus truei]